MKALLTSSCGCLLILAGVVGGIVGCQNTQPDLSEFSRGPHPLQEPSPAQEGSGSFEDSLTGGKVFEMYCAACHNRRTLAERPFSNYQNVAAHMRTRANLTGKEYARLLEFLRRWHDVPPPTSPPEPSPKLLIFSQPMNELRDQPDAKGGAAGEPAKDAPARDPKIP